MNNGYPWVIDTALLGVVACTPVGAYIWAKEMLKQLDEKEAKRKAPLTRIHGHTK